MLTEGEGCGGTTYLELNCSGHQLKAASISHGAHGSVFQCSCGPLTDDELAAISRAERNGTLVWLVFPESQVILSHVAIEVPRPGWAQIEGRVVTVPQLMEWRDTQRPSAGS